MEREWLTVHEVAELLSVHEETVRRWIRDKKLKARRFGGRTGYRVHRDDLAAFMQSEG